MTNKEYLLNRLKQIEDKKNKPESAKLLIIDGTNAFIRSFSVNSTINPLGKHVGGLVGFLFSLSSVIRATNPTKVVIVFDGDSNSEKRKNIYPDYKSHRVGGRQTNYGMFSTIDEQEESETYQIVRLIEYLKCLPISLISIDMVEGDDVIGYIVNVCQERYEKITICSTDKDFIQLINDKTYVYNPRTKDMITKHKAFNLYGIYPSNWVLYRSICGDKSDNIPNVSGIQINSLKKLFPQFDYEDRIELEELALFLTESNIKSKKANLFLSQLFQIKINEKLINLDNNFLLPNEKDDIMQIVEQENDSNITKFLSLCQMDLLGDIIKDPHSFFARFQYLK